MCYIQPLSTLPFLAHTHTLHATLKLFPLDQQKYRQPTANMSYIHDFSFHLLESCS